MLDSGATSHMTGSKSIMTELRPNIANTMVSYGDKTSSQVLGFGKVVVTPDVSLVDFMLVKTLVTTYSQFVLLLLWVFLLSLILIPWSSCGASLSRWLL